MNDDVTIRLDNSHEATISIGSTDGVASLLFEIGALRWIQVTPKKMREIARALKDAADAVEAQS